MKLVEFFERQQITSYHFYFFDRIIHDSSQPDLFKRLKGITEMRPRGPEDASLFLVLVTLSAFSLLYRPLAINIPGEKIG